MAKMDKLADGQELTMSRTETTLMMAEMIAIIKEGWRTGGSQLQKRERP
jgi:hypothetical protein